jgi:hypothetical protein
MGENTVSSMVSIALSLCTKARVKSVQVEEVIWMQKILNQAIFFGGDGGWTGGSVGA